MTSVQKVVFAKLALKTGVEKIEGDRIGVEGEKLKTDHGKRGSTWQGKCTTLTPPMLGREIEEEDDIVNNSGMGFGTKGTTLTKRRGSYRNTMKK
ncbi:hypothetical protein HN51_060221 [Arachis hypogaea]